MGHYFIPQKPIPLEGKEKGKEKNFCGYFLHIFDEVSIPSLLEKANNYTVNAIREYLLIFFDGSCYAVVQSGII